MKIRILVIDDDEDLLFIAEQYLTVQDPEFNLVQVTTAQKALQILDEEQLDAVICDFHLGPDQLNGLQILEWVREHGSSIPFIIFTGKSREEIAIQALNLGADLYLEKGDDLEGLFTEIGYHIKKVVRSKRTEEALQESEQRFRTLVQSLNDLIFVVDSEDIISQYHAAYRADLLQPPGEFIGKHVTEYWPIEIGSKLVSLVSDARASGKRQSFDFELKIDGKMKWYIADLDLHEDKESIVVVVKDISDRKEAELELQKSELRNRIIAGNMSDLVLVYDNEDKYSEYYGDASLLIEPWDVMKGKKTKDMVPHDISIIHDRYTREVRNTGESINWEFELEIQGITRWMQSTMMLHEDKESIVVAVTEITKRKQAELDLRNAEREWRNTFDSQPDLVSVLSSNFEIIKANKRMSDFLGRPPEELIGKKCYELMHQSSEPFPECPLIETNKTGKPASAEIIDPCMGKPFLITTSPIHDDQGEQVGVVHISKDISEQVEAERTIKESAMQFQAIFEQAGIGMALVMNGHILEANSALLKYLGYDENEIKGLTIDDITHPDDRGEDQAALQNLIASDKERYMLEKRYVRKDGEVVWGKLTVSLIRDPRGTQHYAIGMVEDITDRKKAEAQLLEERDRAQSYLDLAGIMILAMDVNLNITLMNKTGCDILGANEEDILGKNWVDSFIPEEKQEEIREYLTEVLSGNLEPTTADEGPILDASGNIRWIQWNDVVIKYEGNKSVGILSAGPDITDKKLAEQERRESESKFRLIFDHAPIGASHSSFDGELYHVNDALEKMLGYSSDELRKMNVEEFTHSDDWKTELELSQELLSGQRDSYSLEKRYFHKDGHIIWGRLNVSITRDEEGKPEIIIGMVEDITERIRAEEQLRESEEKFRAMFEQGGVGMTIVGIDDYIIDANTAYQNLVGYNIDELRKMTIADFTHPDDVLTDTKLFEEIVSGKRDSYQMVKRYIRKDGEMIWVHLTVTVVKDEHDEITFIVGMAEDITGRKIAEIALSDSEQKYRTLIDNVQSGLQITQDGIIVFANEILAEMLGYPINEIVGVPFLKFIAPEDREWVMTRYRKRMAGEDVLSDYDVRVLHKNGSHRQVLLKVANFELEGKLSTIATITDVTDRRKAEEELRESEKRYRILFENLSDGLCITNAEGIITMCSPQAARLFGTTSEEFIGSHFSKTIHPDDKERLSLEFQKGFENKETQPLGHEVKGIRQDGSEFYYHISNTLLVENDEPVGYQSLIRDITEVKRIAVALRESEKGFRQIVESNPMGIHMYELNDNDELVFIGANPAADKLLGVDNSQFIGKTIEQAFPPLANTEIPQKYKEVALKGGIWSTEQIDYTDDKIAGAFEVHAYQTKPRKMAASFFDITERKLIEQAISISQENFQTVFEKIDDLLFIVGLDAKILTTNSSVRDRLGYTEEELSGLSALMVHPPNRRQEAADILSEMIEGKTTVCPVPLMAKDGTIIQVETRITLGRWSGEDVLFGVARDITKRISSEMLLRKTTHDLAESVKELTCLYEATRLLGDIHNSMSDTFQRLVELLPTAWQYPDVACARITIHEETFSSSNFRQSNWKQTANISVYGETIGILEVNYLEEKPDHDEGPFQKEKRNLIDTIAKYVGEFIERKQSNVALRQSEDKYRSIVENIPVVSWTSDENGNTIFISPNVEDVYGFTAEEVCESGSNLWFDRIHPDDVDKVKQSFTKIFESDDEFNIEYRIKRKDNKWIWLQDWSVQNYELNGQKIASGVFLDITQRKQVEEDLRDSEEKLSVVLDNSTDTIMLLDLDGNVQYMNRTISGTDISKIIGTSIYKIRSPEEAESLKQKLEYVRTKRKPIKYEAEYYTADIDTIMVDVSISPLIENNQVNGFIMNVRDITLQKQAAARIEEEKNRVQQYLDVVGSVILTLDNEGTVTSINRQGCEVLGYDADEIIGLKWIDNFIPERLRRDLQEVHHKAMSGKITEIEEYVNPIVTKNGEERLFSWRNVALVDDEGNIYGAISSAVDITDRNNAEERLRAEKDFTENALNSQHDTFFVFDPSTGKAIRWNKVFQEISEYSVEEIASMKAPDSYYDSEDLERASEAIDHLRKEGSVKFELELITKSGKRIPFEYEASLMKYNGGNEYIVSVGRDVTDRKRSEEAIENQLGFIENVLESLKHPFYVIDTSDYTIKLANTIARVGDLQENPTCHYLTHKKEKPCSDSEHPCPLEEVMRTKKPTMVEHQHYDEEGNIRDMHVHAHPIFDKDGNVTQMIEYSLDVTDLKKTMKALEEGEKRFRMLYENAPLAYQTLDENGNILDINSAWLDATGYNQDEVIGRYFGEFLTTVSEGVFREKFPVFRSIGEMSDVEYELIRKDGSQLIGRFSGRTTTDEFGKFKQTACIFQDVTDWKISDALLRKQKEELSELAHIMSHDLGNKMKNIRNLVSIADKNPEEVLQRIGSIAQQSSELLQASADLADAGMVIEKKERVDLNEIVRNIGKTTLPDAITFHCDELPTVLGSPEKIGQIFQNLLTNAIEHGKPTVIEIRKIELDFGFKIIVKNNGTPIPDEIRSKIFIRGFTTKERGSGLGLSIVKKLVEAHDWRFSLEPGVQTSFSIILGK